MEHDSIKKLFLQYVFFVSFSRLGVSGFRIANYGF